MNVAGTYLLRLQRSLGELSLAVGLKAFISFHRLEWVHVGGALTNRSLESFCAAASPPAQFIHIGWVRLLRSSIAALATL